ncbi:hypothetical protein GZH47_05580 [Paenibacillus rhizovicinus]|uniref:Uncharacterized protein n=1 Tax=Paenibacillus rhizovicinus TaxID=2704463 RepID=A0A6C0NVY8_9BACL|nr:hypothetical protein [Paenibacillus rhizovicinus]QHW30365.1 hypothetical protein GZH47_05580 [Paenibacillus rhizovicinus]
MNRYLKLVHWEITRFWKMLAALVLLTIVLQCAGIVYETKKYVNQVDADMFTSHSTIAAYVKDNGKLSFMQMVGRAGLWMYAPVALCIGGIALYIFLIWYKEWYGKNAFVYRLLMLPTARRNIYFAKLTAILLFVLALVAVQLILLPIERSLFMSTGGNELFVSSNIYDLIANNRFFTALVPNTFTDFVIYYGAGTIAVLICFTVVLMERSYRLKGIGAAILYILAVFLFMGIPFWLPGNLPATYFYTNELIGIEAALGVIVAAVTVWLGLQLITKKITV